MCKLTRSLFACSVHIKVKGLRPRSTGFDQVYRVINSPVTPLPQARKRLGRWKLMPCVRHKLQRVWVSVTRSIYYPCQMLAYNEKRGFCRHDPSRASRDYPPPTHTHTAINPPPPKKKKRKEKKTAKTKKNNLTSRATNFLFRHSNIITSDL